MAGWRICARAAGAAAFLTAGAAAAAPGPLGPDGEPIVAELATSSIRAFETASVELRFIQEGGPESGHVRVELTPESRALTPFEVRAAAQQAFLEALNEPGLGEDLKRITVVVRFNPDPNAALQQVFLFLHKGGRDWAVLAGE